MKEFYRGKIKDLLRPGYFFLKEILYPHGRKRLKKNIFLKDLYRGKRAFLLLTGESLQQIDINNLKNEYTFGTGFIFLHEDFEKINLTFYMDTEPSKSFCPSNPSWPKSHLGPLGHKGILTFYREIDERFKNKTILILNNDNFEYIENNNLFKDKTKYFIKGKNDLHTFKGKEYKIIVDLTRRSTSGSGSIFNSIIILIYMGFKEIYLCGAGYTYTPTYQLHFYDNYAFPKSLGNVKAENEAKKVVGSHNKERSTNIEYYGIMKKGDVYRGIYVQKVKKGNVNRKKHMVLNEYSRLQGVKIINIVPNGFESPVYEKITWEEVVNNVLPNQPKLT